MREFLFSCNVLILCKSRKSFMKCTACVLLKKTLVQTLVRNIGCITAECKTPLDFSSTISENFYNEKIL